MHSTKTGRERKLEKKRARDKRNLARRFSSRTAETFTAVQTFEAFNLRVSEKGWVGVKLGGGADVQELMRRWDSGDLSDLLKHFVLIPFVNPHL